MPELDDFQKSCFDAHNELRQKHQSQVLEWNPDLASSASDWAKRLADKGYMQHSDTRLGENIVITDEDDGNITGSGVVDKWAREEALYDYTNPKWQKGTSHFTQMIWKSTTEVGIARVPLESGKGYVIVAHYKPAGNTNRAGDYAKNVLADEAEPQENGEMV